MLLYENRATIVSLPSVARENRDASFKNSGDVIMNRFSSMTLIQGARYPPVRQDIPAS